MALTLHSHSQLAKTCLLCGSSKSSSNISMKHHVKWTDALCKLYRIDIHVDPDATKKGRTENQISDLTEVSKIVKLAFYCFKCYKQLEFVYQLYHPDETDGTVTDGEARTKNPNQNQNQEDSERSKKTTKLRLLRGFQSECELKLQTSIETLILIRKKNLNIYSDINVDEAELHKYNDAYEKEIIKRQQLLRCMLLEARDSADVKPVLIPQFIPSSVLYRSDPFRMPSTPVPVPVPVKDCSGSGSTSTLPLLAPAPAPATVPASAPSRYPPPPPLLYFPPKKLEEPKIIQASQTITKEIQVIELNSDSSDFESDSDSNWEDIEDTVEENNVQSKLVSEFKIHQNKCKPKLTPKPVRTQKSLRSEPEPEPEPVASKPQRQDCQSLLNLLKPLIAKKSTETISTQTESEFELLQSQNNKMPQDDIAEDNNNDTKTQSQNQEKNDPDLSSIEVDLATQIGATLRQNGDIDSYNSILISCGNKKESESEITHGAKAVESDEISKSESLVVNEILIQNSTAKNNSKIPNESKSEAKIDEILKSDVVTVSEKDGTREVNEILIQNNTVENDLKIPNESESEAEIHQISKPEIAFVNKKCKTPQVNDSLTQNNTTGNTLKIPHESESEAEVHQISESEIIVNEKDASSPAVNKIPTQTNPTESNFKIPEESESGAKIDEISKAELQSETTVINYENVTPAVTENVIQNCNPTNENDSQVAHRSESEAAAEVGNILNSPPKSEVETEKNQEIMLQANKSLFKNDKSSSGNLIVSPTPTNKVTEISISISIPDPQPKSAVEINMYEDEDRNRSRSSVVNNVLNKNHCNEIESNITNGFEAEFSSVSVPTPQLTPEQQPHVQAQVSFSSLNPNKSENWAGAENGSSVLPQSSRLDDAETEAGASAAKAPQETETDRYNRFSSIFKCIADKLSKSGRLRSCKTHQNSGGATLGTGTGKTELKSKPLKKQGVQNENRNQYSHLKIRYNLKPMFVVLDRITIIEAPKTDPAPPAAADALIQKRTRSGRSINKPFKLKEQTKKVTVAEPKTKSRLKLVPRESSEPGGGNTTDDSSLISSIPKRQDRKRNRQMETPEENPVPVEVKTGEPVPVEKVAARSRQKRRMRSGSGSKRLGKRRKKVVIHAAKVDENENWSEGVTMPKLSPIRPLAIDTLFSENAEPATDTEAEADYSEMPFLVPESKHYPVPVPVSVPVPVPSRSPSKRLGQSISLSEAGEESVQIKTETTETETLVTAKPGPGILRIGRGIRKNSNSRPRVFFDFNRNRNREVRNLVGVGVGSVEQRPSELLFRYPCTWASCTNRFEFAAHLEEHVKIFHENTRIGDGIQMDRKKPKTKGQKKNKILRVKIAPAHQMDLEDAAMEPICIGFVCGICKKTCPTKLSLSTHKKIHKVTSRASFPCGTCARVFSSNCLLKLHVARLHSNLYQFKHCQHSKCEFAGPNQASLEHHIQTAHVVSVSVPVPLPVPVSAIKIDPDPIQ